MEDAPSPAGVTQSLSSEHKLAEIIEKYRASDNVYDPMIAKAFENDDAMAMFELCMDHDLNLIYKSSPNLEDHEINIKQKALLTLVGEGSDIAAKNIYLREILGLGDEDDPTAPTCTAIQARCFTKHQLRNAELAQDQGAQAQPADLAKSTTVAPPSGPSGFVENLTKHPETIETALENDQKLKRLVVLYHEAKRDFEAVRHRSFDQTRAARFLRDTTENCLNYLRLNTDTSTPGDTAPDTAGTPHAKSDFIAELKATLAHTTAVAERGSGGKKRRFDPGGQEQITKQDAPAISPTQQAPTSLPPNVTAGGHLTLNPIKLPEYHHQRAPKLPDWDSRFNLGADYGRSGNRPTGSLLPSSHTRGREPHIKREEEATSHHHHHRHASRSHHHHRHRSSRSASPAADRRRADRRSTDVDARRADTTRYGGLFVPVTVREEERAREREREREDRMRSDRYRPDYQYRY